MILSPGNRYVGKITYTLNLLDTFSVTAPDVHGTGVAIVELDPTKSGKEYVYGGGTLISSEPTSGTLYCVDWQGNSLWTYNSPSNDYIMLIGAGDVDEDGNNEIVLGTRLQDTSCILLDHTGSFVWDFSFGGGGRYCRFATIGKVRNDYSGKQVFCGGAEGNTYLLDKDGNQIWFVDLTDPVYNTVQYAVIDDINDDGSNEIIVACGLSVRIHNSSGTELDSIDISTANGFTYGVGVGRIQHKDSLQMVGANQDNLALIDPDGTIVWRWSPGSDCYSVTCADLDGDGYDEIVVGWSAGVSIITRYGDEAARYTLPDAVKQIACDGPNNEILVSCDNGNVYLMNIS